MATRKSALTALSLQTTPFDYTLGRGSVIRTAEPLDFAAKPCYNKGTMKNQEMTKTETKTETTFWDALYNAVKDFLMDYMELPEWDEDYDGVHDCVYSAVAEALQKDDGGFYSRLEGSSTYVACDLSEDELDAYVFTLLSYIHKYNLPELVKTIR